MRFVLAFLSLGGFSTLVRWVRYSYSLLITYKPRYILEVSAVLCLGMVRNCVVWVKGVWGVKYIYI